MMPLMLIIGGVLVAAVGSLFFSTLTYALRDFSRPRLADYLDRHGNGRWLEPTVKHVQDLIFVTGTLRLLANLLIVLGVLNLFESSTHSHTAACYVATALVAGAIMLLASLAIPSAAARHAGESLIGVFVPVLHTLRLILLPATWLMHWIDRLVAKAAGPVRESGSEQIEEEIMSAVEEGEKEGVVDTVEREMIESVIQFRDTTAGQIMTARTQIVALELGAPLEQVKQTIEQSGHSRVPVYEGTLDRIAGVLYARDLLKHLGQGPEMFDIRSAMRPAIFVPETKPLRDLLNDFRLQKVHIAIVLDEYGGTTGLVTIEDILEELVGEISDEHEPKEPSLFTRLSEQVAEADARLRLDELNRMMGLSLPEDAGYETLGGFVSTTLGRIPQPGEKFEHGRARFTVTEAEPHRLKRIKIELLLAETNA